MKNYILKKPKNYNKLIDAGIYPVTIKNINVIDSSNNTSKEFDEVQITFGFEDGKTLKKPFKIEIKEYSRFYMLIKAALGEFNDNINLFDIVGCQIEIEITHKFDDNKTYLNVYRVFKYGTNTNVEIEEYSNEDSVEDVDEPEEISPPKKKKRKVSYI
ncbi:hypothetical protein GCM10008905_31710 [Clostridium malenominatum]|uniref:Uncharacterized protein n=1 Tax=Clostridium malenominatum TaxID=1539 RepID=A0ABP3UDC1_9CLOT